ncbi:MAG: DUF979 domain-containing protein [Fusobacteriaceae bacterium]
MNFFLTSSETLGTKLLEIIFIIMGLTLIYAGIKNFLDKKNSSPIGTGFFWVSFGVLLSFGRWIPNVVNGILVVLMLVPPILKKVKAGNNNVPTAEFTRKKAEEIGFKLFTPALAIGICALLFVVFTKLGALVGVGFGVLAAMILLMIYSKENSPKVFLEDGKRLLDTVGPTSVLPMLLATLGALYTKVGVGDIISYFVGKIIPDGNLNIAIVIYGISMALFTMIMGNAFAAITVITVGIASPFILKYGVNPVIIGMLGLTCGYCGTLMTPMAANFNIVPVAMLEMKDKYGVIKKQISIAILILAFQIGYMILFK